MTIYIIIASHDTEQQYQAESQFCKKEKKFKNIYFINSANDA